MLTQYNTIEDVVRSHLSFLGESKGWHRIYCEVCGDGKRTKGPRGGWLFQDEYCAYHCFNCGIDGNFDPTRDIARSKEMYGIFEAFNISKDAVAKLVFDKKTPVKQSDKPKKKRPPIVALDIPNHFYTLAGAAPDNLMAQKAIAYLQSRGVDPTSYPFYLSTGVSNSPHPKDISFAKTLHNRIIIPSMRNNQMVYYTARSMDPESKRPYIKAPMPNDNIIFGFDKIYNLPNNYLFVVEGFFDAYHLKGVAVSENHMTKAQIEILEKSPRKKVIVPDRKGDSVKLAKQGLELDWGVAFPDIGEYKDVTAAIVGQYGKLYVLDSVMKNIKRGKEAEGLLRMITQKWLSSRI